MKQVIIKVILSLLFVGFWSATSIAGEDDKLKSKVSAPANTVRVGSSLGGAYFVDKDLVRRSDALNSQLTSIRKQIRNGDLTSSEAIKQLEGIESELSDISQAIEEQKVLVSAFNVYTKKETIEFPIADDRMIIVTGDKVRIRPWEGRGIKCDLEKTIIAKSQPDEKEFDEIKVVHESGLATEIVGRTPAEREREEAKFLASEEGSKLTREQLANRQKFLQEEIYGPQEKFAPLQGKECNQLSLSGLVWQEGNRQVSMQIESKGGGGTHSSKWQRHAKLTIFVPRSNWVLVRGCLEGVDISGIKSNLILTTEGSRERDYEGSFSVSKITGDIVIDQAPIRELIAIEGNIEFVATDEFVNSGTKHEGGIRTARSFETAKTIIREVSGDVRAHFLRTSLELDSIKGVIDVQNEFGDTRFELEETFDGATPHRIVSESGLIELTGERASLARFPLYAHTLSGVIHSNMNRDVLDTVSFSAGTPRRGWSGFVTPSKDRFSFDKFERPKKAIENQERKPGLDLISRGGRVNILAK